MNNESNLVLELWETVRDLIPAAKRIEVSTAMVRSFVEYGFDKRDLNDVIDEEPYLTRAMREIFEEDDEEEEENNYEDE